MSSHRAPRSAGTRSQPVKATQPFTLQTGISTNSAVSPSSSAVSNLCSSNSAVGVAGSSTGGTAVGSGSRQPGQRRSPGSPGAIGRRLRRHGSPGTSPAPQQRAGPWDMPVASASRFSPGPGGAPLGSKDEWDLRSSSSAHQRPGSVEFEICEKHSQLERQGSSGSHTASPLSRFHCRRVSMDSAELTSEMEGLTKQYDEAMHLPADSDGRRVRVADLLAQRPLSSSSSQASDNDHHSSARVASPVVIRLISGSPSSMYFDRAPPEGVVRLLPTEPQSSLSGHPHGPDRSKVNMTFPSHGTAFRQIVPGMDDVIARQPSPVLVGNGIA